MKRPASCGLAISTVMLATVLTLIFSQLGSNLRTPLYFAAVLISALYGGRLAGICALTLSLLSLDFFFLPPIYSVTWPTTAEQVLFSVQFIGVSLLIIHLANVRNKSEEELRRSAKEIRDLYEMAPCGYHSINRDGVFTRMNQTELDWLGYERSEVLNKMNIRQLLSPEIRALFEKKFAEFMRTGQLRDVEAEFTRKDGSSFPLLLSSSAVYDADGNFIESRSTIFNLTERKRLESLRQAKEAAEAASRAKSEFLANMSHEIRTPLGAVLGFAELLSEPESESSSRHKQWRESLIRNGQQLLCLINDILDLSKIEANRFEIERQDILLQDFIGELATTFERQAISKNIKFIIEPAPNLPHSIFSDSVRLRQILTNLLGNAFKFTPQGEIRMKIFLQDNKLVFSIQDTGIGIAPEHQGKLFQSFTQADSSTTRRFGGSGLGLILSRTLARALGGDVSLAQSAPNGGSTFNVTIDPGPIKFTIQGPPPHPKAPLNGSSLKSSSQFDKRLLGMRILVVDDFADNQVIISSFLQSAGASVEIANDGLSGIQMARDQNPDVVLMDIQMPELDGYSATLRLREQGYSKPIVALTAFALKEEAEKYLKAGFNGYLTKPVSRDRLIENLSSYASAFEETMFIKNQSSSP